MVAGDVFRGNAFPVTVGFDDDGGGGYVGGAMESFSVSGMAVWQLFLLSP